jgi:hypothetical protein
MHVQLGHYLPLWRDRLKAQDSPGAATHPGKIPGSLSVPHIHADGSGGSSSHTGRLTGTQTAWAGVLVTYIDCVDGAQHQLLQK